MCAAVYRKRHLVKAAKVNAGLAESNGKLLPGLWRELLHVTCGLTACTPGSAPGPTLGNEYGKTFPLPLPTTVIQCDTPDGSTKRARYRYTAYTAAQRCRIHCTKEYF